MQDDKPVRGNNLILAIAPVGIVLIATVFRVMSLSDIPNAFSVDEASTGYDAFSMLLTGKDQHGEYLPAFARSFGDFNESLYRFLVIPSIAVFGLNELGTRLPAVFVGVLTVVSIYWLARELFNYKIAIIAALFLAISPWHIQFSRTAYRAILLPLLFCLGLFFFLKGLREKKYLLLSAFAFALSLYSYSSARLFVPLFLIGLIIIYRRELYEHRLYSAVSLAIFLSFFTVLLLFWTSPEGTARASILLETDPIRIGANYLTYFGSQFLFLRGTMHPFFGPFNVGVLHFFEAITVLVGIVAVIRWKTKQRSVLLLWLILYPIPATLTQAAHAQRAIIGAPLFAIISAYGFTTIVSFLESRKRFVPAFLITIGVMVISVALAADAIGISREGFGSRQLVFILLGSCMLLMGITYIEPFEKLFPKEFISPTIVIMSLFILGNVLIFSKIYFVDYAKLSTRFWQYGMGKAIAFSEESSYKNVFMSDEFFIPHIFILFYTQFPPSEYHRIEAPAITQNNWDYTDFHLGKYHVISVSEPRILEDDSLFVIRPDEINDIVDCGYNWQEVNTIIDPAGVEVIKLVEVSSFKDTSIPIKKKCGMICVSRTGGCQFEVQASGR